MVWSQLWERVQRTIAGGRDDGDGSEVVRLSADRYISTERARLEREHLFGAKSRWPVAVLPSGSLADSGQWLAAPVGAALPYVVVRQADGSARAFVNTCRHRGTRLCMAEQGMAAPHLRCGYHGWSYGIDGSLRGLPRSDCFPGVDRETLSLHELRCEERHGLLWVWGPSGSGSVSDYLGPLDSELEHWGVGAAFPYRPYQRSLRGDWKLFIGGALEAYHFQATHPSTVSPVFQDNVAVTDPFGPHLRVCIARRDADQAPPDAPILERVNLSYQLFAGSIFLFVADHAVLARFDPVGIHETRAQITMLLPEAPRSERAVAYWDRNFQLLQTTLDEDFAVQEAQYEGLRAGLIGDVYLGALERGVVRFEAAVDAALAEAA
jgi:phenylpropionate dioxygenase-like ring-hydroxylating dioxygenase large terminal subunit